MMIVRISKITTFLIRLMMVVIFLCFSTPIHVEE